MGFRLVRVLDATVRGKFLLALRFKFRIIALKSSAGGGPDGLKTHPHSEQPQPRKRGMSIQTNSRPHDSTLYLQRLINQVVEPPDSASHLPLFAVCA